MLSWLTLALACTGLVSGHLEIVNQWNLFDFDIPYGYPTNENYSSTQSYPLGMEIGWNRLFLTLPRVSSGAPASLAFIPRNQPGLYGELSPKLQPYPSWDWHRDASAGEHNCTGLVNVMRVKSDRCNRLWVLDSGILDILGNFQIACPPKILVFDLTTDTLVHSITLDPKVLKPNTLLTNLVLDDQNEDVHAYGSCDNTFVYMSDSFNPGLIVYDASRGSSWRLSNPAFYPDPDHGTFRVGGEYFTRMDGVLGLALSPPSAHRTLYFQALSSTRVYSIPTSVLKAGPNTGDDSDLPVSLVGHTSSQGGSLAVDNRDGSLVFGAASETALTAWSPDTSSQRVLARDPELLQFALDIRSAERDNGAIWVMTTRLQKFLRRTVQPDEVNLRILRIVPAYGPPAVPVVPLVPVYRNLLRFKKSSSN